MEPLFSQAKGPDLGVCRVGQRDKDVADLAGVCLADVRFRGDRWGGWVRVIEAEYLQAPIFDILEYAVLFVGMEAIGCRAERGVSGPIEPENTFVAAGKDSASLVGCLFPGVSDHLQQMFSRYLQRDLLCWHL